MADPLWYKDAVIYQAHVRAYLDSNGDGVGDFPGLTQKLDYLQRLGINCLWLMPFYPSPLRDDGYDISDYENIHPSYGTLPDFERFVDEAHRRGIRVITELVINHTSDQHPWFQAARRAPAGSPEREFYVWSDTNKKYEGVRIIFTDTETSNWSWDDTAKAYYWHRFFHHQPDLNFDNPAVLERIFKVMQFWLDRGVDGLRLDAVPYLIEREGTICENLVETHHVLKKICAALDERYPDRMLLAEANQWPADVRAVFRRGRRMPHGVPLPADAADVHGHPAGGPSSDHRDSAPDARHPGDLPVGDVPSQSRRVDPRDGDRRGARLHVSGVCRRSADADQRRHSPPARAAAREQPPSHRIDDGAPFSMPGTPVIYYGDEIGMGDNIYLGDRNGVRTPMQWTSDRNGGFSRADPARLYAPPIMDAVYGYEALNVEAQERSPFSLLSWMKRIIGLRKETTVLGRGSIEFLPARNRKVLPYVRREGDDIVLCIANLARSVQPVELDLSRFKGMTPVEMFGLTEFPKIDDHPYFLTLGPYAFYWFRIQQAPAVTARVAPETAIDVPAAPALFVGAAWETVLDGNVRTLIERDRLLPFLLRQRWFGGKSRRIRKARFVDWGLLQRGPEPLFVTIVEVEFEEGDRDQYFLPLTIRSLADTKTLMDKSPHAILAPVTGARKGLLFDAWLDDAYARALLDALERQEQMATKRGTIKATQTPRFPTLRGLRADLPVTRMGVEQSNTSIVYGTRLILKLFRRLQQGINPDLEIARHLTERTKFTRVPVVAGASEYAAPGNAPGTIAMMQQLVNSQGDGWSHALGAVSRFYEQVGDTTAPTVRGVAWAIDADSLAPIENATAGFLSSAATLGRRTGRFTWRSRRTPRTRRFRPNHGAALISSNWRKKRPVRRGKCSTR